MFWYVLACSAGSDSGDVPDYCPISEFNEAIARVYCEEQVSCGTYASQEICEQNQKFKVDCKDLVYDPTVAAQCVNAIVAYGDAGCGDGLENLFYDGSNRGYDDSFPGYHGCGGLFDGDAQVGWLCGTPKQAMSQCE